MYVKRCLLIVVDHIVIFALSVLLFVWVCCCLFVVWCCVVCFVFGSSLFVGRCWLLLYIVYCLSFVACGLSYFLLILCVGVCLALCDVRCVLVVVA